MTTKRFGARFRGKRSFDGLFSGDNIPLFTDHARPQLVFDLGKVQYSLSALVQATDPCIEALAVRARRAADRRSAATPCTQAAPAPLTRPLTRDQVSGALQTERFLSGRRGDPRTEVPALQGAGAPTLIPCALRRTRPPYVPRLQPHVTTDQVLSWKGWRGPAYPKHWREDRGPMAPLSRVGRQLQQGLQPLTRRLQAPPPDGRSRLDVSEDPVGQ